MLSKKNVATKTVRRTVSREKAIAVACSIIDEDGVEALTIRAVAFRLGIKAPSLYNHFRDKADLLASVARSLLLEAKIPRRSETDWFEYIIQVAVASRRAILKHHRASSLFLEFFPRELLLPAYEKTLDGVEAPSESALMLMEFVEKFTLGSALFAAAAINQGRPAMPEFDKNNLPLLADALSTNPYSDEELFEATLRTLIPAFTSAKPR